MRVWFVGTIPATWTFLSFQFLCVFTIALYFAIAWQWDASVLLRLLSWAEGSQGASVLYWMATATWMPFIAVFFYLIWLCEFLGVSGRMFSCSAFFYLNIENIWSISMRHSKGCHSASIDKLKYIKMSLAQPRHYLHLIAEFSAAKAGRLLCGSGS